MSGDLRMSLVESVHSHDAIRASYFTSLFDKSFSLALGGFMQIAAISLAYLSTRSPYYIMLIVAVTLCAIVRYEIARRFHASKPDLDDAVVARKWERLHVIGLLTATSLVGMFGFLGVSAASTELTVVASTIIVMGTGSSILGKYYGSAGQTKAGLTALTLPYVIGLMLNDDVLHVAMGVLAVPFIWMISKLSGGLRATLFESARGREIIAEIADRFNTALNNMPHGLLMIDDANRIEVANSRLRRQFGIDPAVKIEGRLMEVLFTLARRQGHFASREAAEEAAGEAMAVVSTEGGGRTTVRLAGGQAMQITARRRNKGGAVLLVEDITERLAAEERISRMARYDELTGLQNRAWFKENVDAILSGDKGVAGRCSALFAIDVDEFKGINDTYGHAVGDELLRKLAQALSKLARRNVLVSRFGGDEFAVFAHGLANEAAALDLARRIARILNCHFEPTGCRHLASVSIGYALRDADAQDFQSLMIRADLALYARKNDKRVPFRAYEAELDRKQRERLQLKSDLGAAIRDGSLSLVFQPIVDMSRHRMTSCEALVRWNHPVLGPVSPGVFVPLAEEMGIVGDMTVFVLREACRACAAWPEDISVSVNLSAVDFDRDTLVEDVKQALLRAGLAPARLEVEITETAAIKGRDKVVRTLADLRAHGVKVALDDFGVGYSGLSHLHSLPLDRVKIDRSFILSIHDERSMKLLSAMLALAGQLDLAVTVEGVEDVDTLERVINAGPVEKVQGFVFGRHFSAPDIGELASRAFAPDVVRRRAAI